METKDIIKRYAYYLETIEEIREHCMKGKIPTFRDIKLSRGVMQRAYKEMKAMGIKNIFNYLMWIDAEYGLFQLEKLVKEKIVTFKEVLYRVTLSESYPCFLILFMRNPQIFFDSRLYQLIKELTVNDYELVELDKTIFRHFADQWFEGVMLANPREAHWQNYLKKIFGNPL